MEAFRTLMVCPRYKRCWIACQGVFEKNYRHTAVQEVVRGLAERPGEGEQGCECGRDAEGGVPRDQCGVEGGVYEAGGADSEEAPPA